MLRFLPLLVAAVLFFAALPAHAQSVVINEIMYAPSSPEPEWIELFNADSTNSVDLTKWSVESGTSARLPAVAIQPLGYLVLTKDSLALRSKRAGSYPLVQLALPNLRNSGDTIYLRDSIGRTIDSVPYLSNWGGSGGKSLERIDPQGASNDRSNWVTSKDSSGATIGRANSVRLLDYDLELTGVRPSDSTITIALRNDGKEAASAEITILIGTSDTLVLHSGDIRSQDSVIVEIGVAPQFYGRERAKAFCSNPLDEIRSNDTLGFIFSRPIPRDSLVINEIMYEPSVNSCEWIELYNACALPISLLNTHIYVGERQPRDLPIDTEVIVAPHSFALIAADSLIFNPYPSLPGQHGVIVLNKSTLNLANDSATIVFASYDSTIVDSLHYLSSWHTTQNPIHTGLSLERIDPAHSATDPKNWQTSTDPLGATPLAKNSGKGIRDSATNVNTSMEFSPNPFSPDNDGFEDESTLTVTSGDELDYLMRVRLFDSRGAQIRTLADGASFKIKSEIPFDGKNDRGQTLSPGLYAALIELSSQDPPKIITKTIGVVIAGKRR
jgi:hypothetical protein